jgi:hypothetical protein
MSKRKLAGVIVTGLLLSAGAVNAASPFPSSTNEVSPTGYVQNVDGPSRTDMGAAQPVFPTAAIEHGPQREVYVDVRSAGARPSIAGARTPFPVSVSETGSNL